MNNNNEEITTPKVPGGRPPKFTDPAEMDIIIQKYFEECQNKTKIEFLKDGTQITVSAPEIPTFAGCAYRLGMDRVSFFNYSTKDAFFDTIKSARDYITDKLESKLANSSGNVGGGIFIAKNYGYRDDRNINASIKIDDLIED